MTGRCSTGLLAFALTMAVSAASAQSYTAPAGLPAVVAPGGLEGRAAMANGMTVRGGRAASVPRLGDERDLTTGSARRGEHRSR